MNERFSQVDADLTRPTFPTKSTMISMPTKRISLDLDEEDRRMIEDLRVHYNIDNSSALLRFLVKKNHIETIRHDSKAQAIGGQ
jgi:hypothetical protein